MKLRKIALGSLLVMNMLVSLHADVAEESMLLEELSKVEEPTSKFGGLVKAYMTRVETSVCDKNSTTPEEMACLLARIISTRAAELHYKLTPSDMNWIRTNWQTVIARLFSLKNRQVNQKNVAALKDEIEKLHATIFSADVLSKLERYLIVQFYIDAGKIKPASDGFVLFSPSKLFKVTQDEIEEAFHGALSVQQRSFVSELQNPRDYSVAQIQRDLPTQPVDISGNEDTEAAEGNDNGTNLSRTSRLNVSGALMGGFFEESEGKKGETKQVTFADQLNKSLGEDQLKDFPEATSDDDDDDVSNSLTSSGHLKHPHTPGMSPICPPGTPTKSKGSVRLGQGNNSPAQRAALKAQELEEQEAERRRLEEERRKKEAEDKGKKKITNGDDDISREVASATQVAIVATLAAVVGGAIKFKLAQRVWFDVLHKYQPLTVARKIEVVERVRRALAGLPLGELTKGTHRSTQREVADLIRPFHPDQRQEILLLASH